jgi:plasmid stability protein
MDKLIRNIPDDVAELLKKQAKAKGLTLEAYMRLILIEAAKSKWADDGTKR